jgi:sugar phosphate permease
VRLLCCWQGAAQIGTLGSLFPVAAVPAVLMAGQLQQRLTPKQRQWVYAPLLGVSTVGMLVLSSMTVASPIIAPILVAIMFGVGPTLYVPNYDFVMRFGGPFTGTLTGFCDLFVSSRERSFSPAAA